MYTNSFLNMVKQNMSVLENLFHSTAFFVLYILQQYKNLHILHMFILSLFMCIISMYFFLLNWNNTGDHGGEGWLRVDRLQLSDASRCESFEGAERQHQTRPHGGVCRSIGVRKVDLRTVAWEVLRPAEGQSC